MIQGGFWVTDEVADYKRLLELYVEKFGQEPQFTGWNWTVNPHELIIEAIETGVPIKEPPVPKGTFT